MLDLRTALPDDPDAVRLTEEVQRYYVELYGGPDRDPMDPRDFAPPSGGFLVGYADGLAVAMGGWTREHDRPGTAKLKRMYVSPAVRRRGYAATLLAAIEDDARAAGVTELVLTTGRPQQEAIALYRALGYDEVEPFGYYAATAGAVHLGKRLT